MLALIVKWHFVLAEGRNEIGLNLRMIERPERELDPSF